jgi:hypothetical protein
MKRLSKFLWEYAKPISFFIIIGITLILWSFLLDYILSQIK